MSLTMCHVHFTTQSSKAVYMSYELLEHINVSPTKKITFVFGNEKVEATVKPTQKTGNHLFFPAEIKNKIYIPKAGKMYISHVNKDEIKLGPLIGIISDGPGGTTSPFGSRTAYIKQLLKDGNEQLSIYAFAPRDINWNNKTVNGYFVSKNGAFCRKTVPLPDVIYNRLPSRRTDFSPFMNQLRKYFIKHNIPFFNWSFFNKSDIYHLLEKDPNVVQYIPESVSNPSEKQIQAMLEKYKSVYYKPTGGSLGHGIYRLTYSPKKGYYVRYRDTNGNVLLRFNNFKSLMNLLKEQLGNKMKRYIAQRGIDLVKVDDRPIDFRFHMHKNGDNEWKVVGLGAKKAGKGSVTTHVNNGGQLMKPIQALSHTFGDRAELIVNKSKTVAIELAKAIEMHYPHLLGEIGFDIGIDQEENIWMFEANAKPGRSMFHHPSLQMEGKSSVDHIFQHCLYLSKFNQKQSC